MKTQTPPEYRTPSTGRRVGGAGRAFSARAGLVKLLVVDDNADIRWLIRYNLGRAYDVVEAGSGEEALSLARREKPRLILLDVSMPDMDGLEVLRALRELDPEISVIMLTGDARMEVAHSALQCGARSYITKPFSADTLCSEVGRLLEGVVRQPATSDLPWRVVGTGASRSRP